MKTRLLPALLLPLLALLFGFISLRPVYSALTEDDFGFGQTYEQPESPPENPPPPPPRLSREELNEARLEDLERQKGLIPQLQEMVHHAMEMVKDAVDKAMHGAGSEKTPSETRATQQPDISQPASGTKSSGYTPICFDGICTYFGCDSGMVSTGVSCGLAFLGATCCVVLILINHVQFLHLNRIKKQQNRVVVVVVERNPMVHLLLAARA